MNRYLRAAAYIPCGILKAGLLRLLRGAAFCCAGVCAFSPFSEIELEKGGSLSVGRRFRMRDGAKLRVRKGGNCQIGENVCLNSQNIITCRQRITIGSGVLLSPNVQIYDHDHDYRSDLTAYRTSPVEIGDGCWIGANTVILRGTKLGAGCVVGAGSVIKGTYPPGSVIIQKRRTWVKESVEE